MDLQGQVKPKDRTLVQSVSLLTKLGLYHFEVMLREKHLERFDEHHTSGAIHTVHEMFLREAGDHVEGDH